NAPTRSVSEGRTSLTLRVGAWMLRQHRLAVRLDVLDDFADGLHVRRLLVGVRHAQSARDLHQHSHATYRVRPQLRGRGRATHHVDRQLDLDDRKSLVLDGLHAVLLGSATLAMATTTGGRTEGHGLPSGTSYRPFLQRHSLIFPVTLCEGFPVFLRRSSLIG